MQEVDGWRLVVQRSMNEAARWESRPIRVVVADNTEEGTRIVVTVYEPDLEACRAVNPAPKKSCAALAFQQLRFEGQPPQDDRLTGLVAARPMPNRLALLHPHLRYGLLPPTSNTGP